MKKKMLRKLCALGLSAVMAVSLAACGNSSSGEETSASQPGQGEASSDEAGEDNQSVAEVDSESYLEGDPVEISIAIWNADEAFAGDEVLSEIEKKLNIKIKPVNVTWDDFAQKIQLWASSGSLPDVFSGDFRNTSSYPQWADQGVIKAIPDNLDAYPTLKEYLQGQAAQEAKLNGVLYCLPRQTYPSQEWTTVDREIAYRWDLAQKAGVTKEPETWEEFSEMILAIIEADPDGTGIGGLTANSTALLSGIFMPYVSPLVAQVGNSSAFKWEMTDDGTYKPIYFAEDVTAGFQLGRDMYESGVIEKDIVLTSNQTSDEKFLQGKSAAILYAGGYGSRYEKNGVYWEEVHGSDFLDDVKILNLMPDQNGNPSYPVWGYAWSESFINASVDDVKLDRILRLYDYLLSDEGAFLATYGPEGDLYDLVDGKVVLHDENAVITDAYPSVEALGVMARWNPSCYDDRFVAAWPSSYTAVDTAVAQQAAKVELPEYNQRCTQLVMELGIDFVVNFDDDFLNIITGEEPVEKMWADILAGYEADGLQDMINQVNEALAAE